MGDDVTCDLCGVASWVDGNELLLCDACPKAFHCQCLTPQMHSVPEGDWFCPSCGAAANSPPDDATATATAAFSSTTTSSSAAASIATALWDRLCTAHATPTAASEPQQQPPRRLPRQIKGPVGSHVTASGEIDSIDKVLDGRMVGAHPDVKVQASGDDAALDVATIDATLWAGAAAAGWSLEHNECSGKVEYVSPSGKRFGTLQYIRKKFGGAGGAGGVGGAGGGGGRSGRSARSARGGKAYVENDGDDKEDEEEDRGETCEVCGLESWIEGNELLLCDTCPKAFHTQCLTPPLASVPEGDWFCPSCASATNPPAGPISTNLGGPISTNLDQSGPISTNLGGHADGEVGHAEAADEAEEGSAEGAAKAHAEEAEEGSAEGATEFDEGCVARVLARLEARLGFLLAEPERLEEMLCAGVAAGHLETHQAREQANREASARQAPGSTVCPLCYRVCASVKGMRRHLHACRGKQEQDEKHRAVRKADPAQADGSTVCPLCYRVCASVKGMRRHLHACRGKQEQDDEDDEDDEARAEAGASPPRLPPGFRVRSGESDRPAQHARAQPATTSPGHCQACRGRHVRHTCGRSGWGK